jgi:hypothetical protein
MDNALTTWARQAITEMRRRAEMMDHRRITSSLMRDGQIVDTTAEDADDLRRQAIELEALIAGAGDARLILPPGHS